jgi:hypothetical protein
MKTSFPLQKCKECVSQICKLVTKRANLLAPPHRTCYNNVNSPAD